MLVTATLAAAALVVVVVVVAVLVRRRQTDPVANFQRQIDALSPEARRPVVDQVQRIENDDDEPGATDHGS